MYHHVFLSTPHREFSSVSNVCTYPSCLFQGKQSTLLTLLSSSVTHHNFNHYQKTNTFPERPHFVQSRDQSEISNNWLISLIIIIFSNNIMEGIWGDSTYTLTTSVGVEKCHEGGVTMSARKLILYFLLCQLWEVNNLM